LIKENNQDGCPTLEAINMFNDTLKKLLNGASLSFEEAESAMEEIMTGQVSEIKLSSWLTALKLKGETADEIGGCAASMNNHSTKIYSADPEVVDIVGTGGDGAKTFNISTAAAFVAAGAGITVAKHGNRAVSSKSGAADVLTEHGINISISPLIMEKCLNDVGISFLFAQMLHPAMKYAMPVRKELGTRTIFNILGPLCNPAETKRMTIGVYSKHLCRLIAEAALKLNKKHILVVHGNDGLDEITTTTSTHICEVRNGEISEYDFDPETAGISLAKPEDIQGGTPSENAQLIRNILAGTLKGPARNIVVINAASSIIVSDKTTDWKEAANIANESIDSGKALAKLDALIECSQA
jgi:anthranilate phosphoribosyltransferase